MSTYKTVATWNIERGIRYLDVTRMLKDYSVDIALLQECDVGMARSGNVHTPRLISEGLGYAYTMAIEFEEEGLGNRSERAAIDPGAVNKNGLHCNAIVAKDLPFMSHHVELSMGREWEQDDHQPRCGGRIALISRIGGVHFVSLHLENRTSPEKRTGQINRLLRALDKLGAARVVIGGDLNNKDPDDSHLFRSVSLKDYRWIDANDDVGRFGGRRLDWFFYKGVEVKNPRTVDASGVSDHDLMLLDVLM